ncbi:YncE family protein [Planotetraspora mira]|uniref:YncE family protein n=1 Tax=Planotetraspora mira TaxID=58121 RepID=UPI003671EEB9
MIDTATNTVIATVPVGSSPADVAVSRGGTRVYVTNLGATRMTASETERHPVPPDLVGGRGAFSAVCVDAWWPIQIGLDFRVLGRRTGGMFGST